MRIHLSSVTRIGTPSTEMMLFITFHPRITSTTIPVGHTPVERHEF
jgi:hypothetical protein